MTSSTKVTIQQPGWGSNSSVWISSVLLFCNPVLLQHLPPSVLGTRQTQRGRRQAPQRLGQSTERSDWTAAGGSEGGPRGAPLCPGSGGPLQVGRSQGGDLEMGRSLQALDRGRGQRGPGRAAGQRAAAAAGDVCKVTEGLTGGVCLGA